MPAYLPDRLLARRLAATAFSLCVLLATASMTIAAPLVSGLGGDRGYGEGVLAANDDGSTAAIPITSVFGPAGLNFFGTNFTSIYVNNNGHVTFGSANGDFEATAMSAAPPMLAVWWADVDTRGAHLPAGSNLVYYDVDPAGGAVTVTWDAVGYFDSQSDLLNSFQLRLIDRGGGDFDIEYRYADLQWSAPFAPGAGISAGDGVRFFDFDESLSNAEMLELVNRSNVDTPGLFRFVARSGSVEEGGPDIVTTSFGSGDDNILAVAVQADGKIVAAGRSHNGSHYDFAVARYLDDGTLDTTFSGDGKLTVDIAGEDDLAYGVAIQPDGKIVLAGMAFNGSESYNVALVRLLSNGTLDTSFSGDGKHHANYGGDDRAHGVSLQPDGKIVIGGMSGSGGSSDFLVARFLSDGSADTSFAGDGSEITNVFGGYDQGNAVALQADGRIVVGGLSTISGTDDFAIVRYNSDGTLDTSFSGDGKVSTAIGSGQEQGNSIAVQSDGRIVLAGFSHNGSNLDFAAARYLADGTLDTSFDGDGKVSSAFGTGDDVARDLSIDPWGNILLGGYAAIAGYNDFALARYTTTGALDTTFHGDGKVVTKIGEFDDNAIALTTTATEIILAGGSHNGSSFDFAMARYLHSVAECGNGAVEAGEQCDDDNLDAGDCCSASCQYEAVASSCASDENVCTVDACDGSGSCLHTPGNAGTTCRSALGDCDAGETCDGLSASCPADAQQPAGTTCSSDGNVCTVDECNGSGTCLHIAGNAGATCRGLGGVCDIEETCDGVSTSCPADAKSTDVCRFAAGECDVADSCDGVSNACPADAKKVGGTACTADSNVCTDDVCDGSGDSCTHPGNAASCDDGVFCNGGDTCSGGSCSVHAGDPCTGGSECADACNEAGDHCFDDAGTACTDDANVCTDDVCDGSGSCGVDNTASCDDGAFCNGADTCGGGICNHSGDPCAGGGDCADVCNEAGDHCNEASGASCDDDGSECTLDRCTGTGSCAHPPITLAEVCNYAIVGGSDTVTAKVRTRANVVVGGGICTDKGDAGLDSVLLDDSSWVFLHPTSTAAKVRGAILDEGNAVTGGGCLKATKGLEVFETGLGSVCCEQSPATTPGGGVVDTCGMAPELDECREAKMQVAADLAALNALTPTDSRGALACTLASPCTITGDEAINVIDIDRIQIAVDSVLTIDAEGDPDKVFVLRLAGGIRGKLGGSVVLAGGAQPKNVAFYAADGNCEFGDQSTGSGTLFCPNGKVRLKVNSSWTGAIGAGKSVDLGDNVVLIHEPFLGLAF